MKKFSRTKIGETFISNEGYNLEVVDGGSTVKYCTVRIDNKYETEAQFHHVKNGKVKNVYHTSVYGKGYFGEGIYNKTLYKQYYEIWSNIIYRCYDSNYHKKHPTYKDVEVCDDWLNFQIFAEWFDKNYIIDYEIDKDLLSGTNKIYSPNTCVFIPQALNSFLTNKQVNNTTGMVGVYWNKENEKYHVGICDGVGKRNHIGSYDSLTEAGDAYKIQRAIYVEEWKRRMKNILPQQAIDNIK